MVNKLQRAQAVWMSHWTNCSTGAELPARALEPHGAAQISGQTSYSTKKLTLFWDAGMWWWITQYKLRGFSCASSTKSHITEDGSFVVDRRATSMAPTIQPSAVPGLGEPPPHYTKHSLIRWDCHIWHHVLEILHLWALREFQVRLNSAARRPGFEQPPSSTSWGRLVDICVFEAELLIGLNMFLKRLG